MNEAKYAFWIEILDEDGNTHEVRWSNLTHTQATRMYSMTSKSLPLNVKTHGWEEQK